jgi:excisionase family DNA binding protein
MPKTTDLSGIPGLLTLREAASLINVHPNTLRNWEKEGKIDAVRIGTRKDRRFRKKTLEDICK